METFLSRYRNLTVLLLLLMAQLLLLAYQVKTETEVRLIRIWAVTAVTPLARTVESISSYWNSVFQTLVRQRVVLQENEQLKAEVAKLRLDNQYLQTELSTADRAKALLAFRQTIPSKTLGARVIGTGTGANARVVYVDRGSTDGIRKGMAVITSRGIAGKVVAVYPTASLVTLVTQQGFAAGVLSQKSRVRAMLRGVGSDYCQLDYVQEPSAIEDREMFYTSGDDRVFPKGLPVGPVKVNKKSATEYEFRITPSGLQNFEEVLVVTEGVHGDIPPLSAATSTAISLLPPPPGDGASPQQPATPGAGATDADRLLDRYRKVGAAQGHTFGTGYGRVPDFNKPPAKAPSGTPSAATPGATAPAPASGTPAPTTPAQPAGTPAAPPKTQAPRDVPGEIRPPQSGPPQQ